MGRIFNKRWRYLREKLWIQKKHPLFYYDILNGSMIWYRYDNRYDNMSHFSKRQTPYSERNVSEFTNCEKNAYFNICDLICEW